MKSVLIVISHPPLASSANQEALDIALAAASFDQKVGLLFEDDGTLQLIENQTPDNVGRKNLPKTMKALPIYGIEDLYAFSRNDHLRHPMPSNIKVLDCAGYQSVLERYDSVLRF